MSATVLCLTPVTACNSSSSVSAPGSPPPPGALQHPMLEGFPIPNGFSSVPERSNIIKSGDLRQGTCEFAGEMDPTGCSRFYREYMGSAGYTLRQESMIGGEWVMVFDSPSERANVRFRRKGLKTNLVIEVSPTSPGSVEHGAKAPSRKPTP